MPQHQWSVLPAAAGLALRRAGGATDVDPHDPMPAVLEAASVVDGLHFLADLLASVAITKNEPVLGHPAQTVDLAWARWAVADTITAIDLASAALGRLRRTHPHPQTGREMDFGSGA